MIGGGLLGLEGAKALRDLELDTHVVEFAPRLMAVQVDEGGARVLRRKIEELGVTVHTQKNTMAIVDGEAATHRMQFADGSHLETDMIVFSAGIRPRDELARACGLEVGPRGGIVIDDSCVTSDPDIYAIGECALWGGLIFGLVAPGYEMARIAARHVLQARGRSSFKGADMSTKLKLMGVDVASLGDAHGNAPGSRSYQFIDERKQVYKKMVVSDGGKYLLGGVLVGDASEYGTLLQMMLNEIELPESPEFLILPQADGQQGRPGRGRVARRRADLLLQRRVERRPVRGRGRRRHHDRRAEKLHQGRHRLRRLRAAGDADHEGRTEEAGHGGQQPCLRALRLFAPGAVPPGARRQDPQLSTSCWRAHGHGLGCDICKPAGGHILASCWNEFVLKPVHASLQDTNDYFLANMQKDGTYSVVPRMPGGEITPDNLIAIGMVAKNIGLYTKITGGQRIDLFGAHVDQLPAIWEELIAAGFESGHAYGKSLRTVKSCVGSTWCRYGVQDSVGFAIELENRYKGLRSPHKIKFGVSGCTRECAEAQGKDVGLIATEKGWNLYVCGNGGMKPRHADLLAVRSRRSHAGALRRPLPDVLRPHGRPPAAHQRLARQPRRRPRLPQARGHRRQPGHRRRAGGGHAARGRHLCLRVEDGRRRPGPCASASAISSTATSTMKTWCSSRSAARSARPRATNAAARDPILAVKAEHERDDELSGVIADNWMAICALDDIVPDTGVCALVNGRQVAVFRVGDEPQVFALDNSTRTRAPTCCRAAWSGSLGERIVVASPIYKQHFDLRSGRVPGRARALGGGLADARGRRHGVGGAVNAPRARGRRLVVVGNGMAGMRTVEELLKLAPDLYDITVFGAEPHGNYNRILLSPLLAGEKTVRRHHAAPARVVCAARHHAACGRSGGAHRPQARARCSRSRASRSRYDRLLLATGSDPFILPVPGQDLPGVVDFRDLDDVDTMLRAAREHRHAVVIGGGLLGLEAANGLQRQGMDVTVVHMRDSLMDRQLDAAGVDAAETALEARGLRFLMQAQTARNPRRRARAAACALPTAARFRPTWW